MRGRSVSPVELVDHYLERIASLNDSVGAFVTDTAEEARSQAREAERRIQRRENVPPLHGVPTAIKDLTSTAGVRTMSGSLTCREVVPTVDAHVVTLLRRAGTISLGKTNTPEFGLPSYTESSIAPPARTPWDLGRSAGGSSGGAAAAVAAGFVPFAQGSDGGGSIRIPASVCGLVGLKTSRGRVSNGPRGGDTSGLAGHGPIGRTVGDVAAMLDAIAIPMPGDPQWAPQLPPGESFRMWAKREPGRLRIARHITPLIADVPVDPRCVEAWEEASQLLEALGHEVEDIAVPFDPDLGRHFKTLWTAGAASRPVEAAQVNELTPLTRWLRAQGELVSAADYLTALGALQRIARGWVIATSAFDAVLTPTLALPPVPVGWFTAPGDPAVDFERQCAFTPFTSICNISGQPAITLPLHWSAEGLPIGVMLIGRAAGDAALLSLAAQVERASTWTTKHPPCWGD